MRASVLTLLGLATAFAETVEIRQYGPTADHKVPHLVEGMREHPVDEALRKSSSAEAKPISLTSLVEADQVEEFKVQRQASTASKAGKNGWSLYSLLFQVDKTPNQLTCCCADTTCTAAQLQTPPTGDWKQDGKQRDATDDVGASCCMYFAGTDCTGTSYESTNYTTQNENYMCPNVISPTENFCHHLTDDSFVQAKDNECNNQVLNCANSYRVNNGSFSICEVITGFGGGCTGSSTSYDCPWTFYMNDMIANQQEEVGMCYSDMLEARRSLDGLLHAVNQTFGEMMVENNQIAADNITIRDALSAQQTYFTQYLGDQDQCMTDADTAKSTQLQGIEDEISDLIAIARPDVRSAVNFDRDHGYQAEARDGYVPGASLLETTVGFTGEPGQSLLEKANSFLETTADLDMGAEACHSFTSLVRNANTKFKMGLHEPDCHEERVKLQKAFNDTYIGLAAEYDEKAREVEVNRSICLQEAEYEYKSLVEGVDGVDFVIQQAAQRIHTAQHTIGVMEPRLHDLEHAVKTVRDYIDRIKSTCVIDDTVTSHLTNIRELIEKMQECPGLNDFTLTIPHWTPARIATPSPTPWPIWGPLRGPREISIVPASPSD